MNLNDIHNVYFIGIGGIGMSALARYFKSIGKKVGGYDRTQTPLVKELIALDISVTFEEAEDTIPEAYKNALETLVVYTPAVPDSHAQLQYFNTNGYSVKKRSEVLGLITKDTYCFAVAGTHGKTTTSCILAHLLKEAGVPFMAFLGGVSEDFNSNYVLEGTKYAVVEADEYDRSFLQLYPNVACITSMEADHLDIYENEKGLQQAFHEFIELLQPEGKLCYYHQLPLSGLSYGIEVDAAYAITELTIENGRYVFDLKTPDATYTGVEFSKPGRHNLLNALAAFAMADQIDNVSKKMLIKGLKTFKGVQRRFSYQIKENDFVFIDDYAHHPTEIKAAFQAVKEMHPNKKVAVVFQPHLFSRTQDFAEEFAESLNGFNWIFLLEIYPARELPIEGITAEWLLEKIENPNKKVIQKNKIIPEIEAVKPDVLITLGAGDIGLEVVKIKNNLRYAS